MNTTVLPTPSGMSQQSDVKELNPLTYLGQTFKDPVTLLASMFSTGCVLSGSRALEYFVPGSTDCQSDWDFYVPGYHTSISATVNVLKHCGVEWSLKTDEIENGLLSGLSDSPVIVSRKTLICYMSWVKVLPPDISKALLGQQTFSIITKFRLVPQKYLAKAYRISHNTAGDIEIEPQEDGAKQDPEYPNPSGESFDILRGAVQTSRGAEKVQLIIGQHYGNIRGCMSFLKSFYSSHVQCFISGWCAGHLFYKESRAKEAIKWKPRPGQSSCLVSKAQKKYEKRGYRFSACLPSVQPTIMDFSSPQALLVDYGDLFRPSITSPYLDIFEDWLAQRREHVQTLCWLEIGGNVEIFNPMRAWCSQDTSGPGPSLLDIMDSEYTLPLLFEEEYYFVRSGLVSATATSRQSSCPWIL